MISYQMFIGQFLYLMKTKINFLIIKIGDILENVSNIFIVNMYIKCLNISGLLASIFIDSVQKP